MATRNRMQKSERDEERRKSSVSKSGNAGTQKGTKDSVEGAMSTRETVAATTEKNRHAPALLEGYTLLDLTDVKGQLCGRFLADLGMEVVKIEPPGGDPTRRLPPFFKEQQLSLRFAHLNANKRSVELDLDSTQDRAAFQEWVRQVDVMVESFAPGYLSSIGLGYAELAGYHPGLVMASITGFGQTGPHSGFACTDSVAFAMSGLMYIAGEPDLPPCLAPETQAYYFGSLTAALGVVAALYRREQTGTGDWVDVSMQETLATQEHTIRLYANEGEILRRSGSQHGHVAPGKVFPCKDGYVYLYVSRRDWKRFLEVWQDHPKELEEQKWLNNLYRREQAVYINREVSRFTERFSVADLTLLLQSHRIPCLPVNRPQDFIADPQVNERRVFTQVSYPMFGTVTQPSLPFLLDGRRCAVRPAPVETPQKPSSAAASENTSSERKPGQRPRTDESLPLTGMRVLSFDHVLAGPYGMTLLADLGAEIIKIESAKGGLDPFRFFGTGEDPNLSPRFWEFNRNKRSLTVNLKHSQGPALIRELAKHCDLVMDNFAARVLPALGLDYDTLVKTKPDIITLRMPGLGSNGPKKDYVTLGTNITAFTGFTYLWNHPEKLDPPTGSQTVLPDYASGLLAAIVAVAASLYRKRTGRGLSIDLSQAEAAAFMIGVSMMQALNSEEGPLPAGNHSSLAAPHGVYRCKGEDRWCVIAVEANEQWLALAAALEQPALLEDVRFRTQSDRIHHREELDQIIQEWTRHRDAHQVMRQLQVNHIPCGVVQNGADLVADEHLKERGFLVECDNPRIGRITLPGPPLRFAACSTTTQWEFPELGRDNAAVLSELLGYTPERISELDRDGLLE